MTSGWPTPPRRSSGSPRRRAALGDKLGPVLFQLPPNLKKDLPRLDDFLASLPAGLRATVEFRHESWFSDDVYGCLRTQRAALCIAESDDFATPLEATAGWGYLRLRRENYDDAAAWPAGARASRPRRGRRPTSSSSTRTPARGRSPPRDLHELMAMILRRTCEIWTLSHIGIHWSTSWHDPSLARRSPSVWCRSRCGSTRRRSRPRRSRSTCCTRRTARDSSSSTSARATARSSAATR